MIDRSIGKIYLYIYLSLNKRINVLIKQITSDANRLEFLEETER